jgi:AraC-like DNA-binding protein
MIINNIEPHGIVLEEGQKLSNMVIHFEPKFVWQAHNDFDIRYLKIFFDRNVSFSHKLDNSNPATLKIRALLVEMEDEFRNKDSEYELMVKVQLLNVLVLLLRHYGYVKTGSGNDHISEIKIINQVTDYIDIHFTEEIKLKELADIAHMTSTYFSAFFKKYVGISPIDYIIRRRISRSMDYLLATDKSILEIAGVCGFNNSTNYNKMFKKISAMTPSEFRRADNYRLKL